jgi:hypothetical protein
MKVEVKDESLEAMMKTVNFIRVFSFLSVVVGLVWSHDPKSYAGGSVCYW